mmetsp:Transcript_37492/g.117188  ORF Transcript_37492/g.117188 Transcript_37492/m.117188 type:complete len:370 (-) Transcript_37492:2222-3331(-)
MASDPVAAAPPLGSPGGTTDLLQTWEDYLLSDVLGVSISARVSRVKESVHMAGLEQELRDELSENGGEGVQLTKGGLLDRVLVTRISSYPPSGGVVQYLLRSYDAAKRAASTPLRGKQAAKEETRQEALGVARAAIVTYFHLTATNPGIWASDAEVGPGPKPKPKPNSGPTTKTLSLSLIATLYPQGGWHGGLRHGAAESGHRAAPRLRGAPRAAPNGERGARLLRGRAHGRHRRQDRRARPGPDRRQPGARQPLRAEGYRAGNGGDAPLPAVGERDGRDALQRHAAREAVFSQHSAGGLRPRQRKQPRGVASGPRTGAARGYAAARSHTSAAARGRRKRQRRPARPRAHHAEGAYASRRGAQLDGPRL